MPKQVTSSKNRLSSETRCSSSNMYTWNGFSKSAGAFGVITQRRAVGADDARQLDHVERRVDEVLDDVRRDDVVDAAVAKSEAGAVGGDEPQGARSRRARVGRVRLGRELCGVCAVVDADHEAVGALSRSVSSPMPQPTSRTTPGPRRAIDLAVARVVQREEGVGGGARHGPLTGVFQLDLHRFPGHIPRAHSPGRFPGQIPGTSSGAGSHRASNRGTESGSVPPEGGSAGASATRRARANSGRAGRRSRIRPHSPGPRRPATEGCIA